MSDANEPLLRWIPLLPLAAALFHGISVGIVRRATSSRLSLVVSCVALAGSVRGVNALFGGFDRADLEAALEKAHAHEGLSLIHVPVYWGADPIGGMGAYGRWNVGDWCDEVQDRYHSQLL